MRDRNEKIPVKAGFVWLGLVSGALFWILESLVHTWVFHHGGFWHELLTPDAHEVWMRLVTVGLFFAFGICVQCAVNKRKKAEAALRRAEETYRSIFENAMEGIFQATPGGELITANQAMAAMLGYASPTALVRAVNIHKRRLFADPGQWDSLSGLVTEKGEITGRETELLCKDKSRIWALISAKALYDPRGRPDRIQGVVADITDRKMREMALRRQATHDELTGLQNRVLLGDTLSHMLAQAERTGERLAVLYIDLDSFKQVNDEYGHHRGDELLRQTADRLRARLRESDRAARVGGDEFVVLLWNPAGIQEVEKVARELNASLNRPYDLGEGIVCNVTASIGGSLYPRDGKDPDDLVRLADAAMYKAKQSDKGGFRMTEDRE